jgi:hypothetical protein
VDPVGAAVLVAVLVGAGAFGTWRRRTDGQLRLNATQASPAPMPRLVDQPGSELLAAAPAAESPPAVPADEPPAAELPRGRAEGVAGSDPGAALRAAVGDLGARATLVQLSSAFCAPCRTARILLSDVAATEPGVRHVEIDAESHLDLVRTLGVTRTPTTLVLDGHGQEVGRASGVPRRDQLRAVLAAVEPPRTTT